MKRVVTSYGEFSTGDGLADAVGQYGLALARAHQTDNVEFPYVTARGATRQVMMRIGWLVDLALVEDDGDANRVEPLDTQSAEDMRLRSQALDERLLHHGGSPARSWTFWEHYL